MTLNDKVWLTSLIFFVLAFICGLVGGDAAEAGWIALVISVILALVGVWTL